MNCIKGKQSRMNFYQLCIELNRELRGRNEVAIKVWTGWRNNFLCRKDILCELKKRGIDVIPDSENYGCFKISKREIGALEKEMMKKMDRLEEIYQKREKAKKDATKKIDEEYAVLIMEAQLELMDAEVKFEDEKKNLAA